MYWFLIQFPDFLFLIPYFIFLNPEFLTFLFFAVHELLKFQSTFVVAPFLLLFTDPQVKTWGYISHFQQFYYSLFLIP